MASPSRNYLLEMFAEFSRAVAAAKRYDDLRYRSASHAKIPPDEIPRRVLEEFYPVGEPVQSRHPAPRRSDATEGQPGTARALS